MGKVDLPYVHSFKDRHGKMRFYYRRNGHRQTISGEPGSDAFMESYQRIHATFLTPDSDFPTPDTFGYLVAMYYNSPEFLSLKDSTKKIYRRLIEEMNSRLRFIKLHGITRKVVKSYRDSLHKTPVTANNSLRVMKTLFAFAIDNEVISVNPASGVKSLKNDSDGWTYWPEDALERFSEKSTGAARIAFYLALYTGQRRADVLTMRWDDVKDGWIHVVQEKTGAALWIPIHPVLKNEMDATREKYIKQKQDIGETIVQRENGKRYTHDGFATIWNREQHKLNCVKLPFHGLRKNATIKLFEAGCTPQQVQAITGHGTLEMVEHYGKGSNQKKLAAEAMKLLIVEN